LGEQSPVATTQNELLAQFASTVHLAMQLPPEQTKLAAQSVFTVQLVLQAVPEQMKLFAQFLGLGNLQVPAEQVPGSMTLGPEQDELPHEPVGNEQVLLA
jgi:hypothetical protein